MHYRSLNLHGMDNARLAQELIGMAREDLLLRAKLASSGELFGGYNPRMRQLHDTNAYRLQAIVAQWGWPPLSVVGRQAAHAAWLVLQHAVSHPGLQRTCLSLLQSLVRTGEADAIEAAMLEDRIRCFEGKPQFHGTQFDWDEGGNMSPLPVDDPALVDERRRTLGLAPMIVEIGKKRSELLTSGERPPADLQRYRQERLDWLRTVGWRPNG
jgi:hypothetical protein